MAIISAPGIPIIGRSGSWSELHFGFQPLVKAPLIDSPVSKPELIGWGIRMMGVRSDGTPVIQDAIIDIAKITKDPIATVLSVVQTLVGNFDTFRNCSCVPGSVCQLHTPQKTSGRPS